MLSTRRVLDLTSGGSMLCGRILSDLGADVIKVEKPGGDSARNIGPFYHDSPEPEKSLFWFAYNLGKRGITLDIATDNGRDIFKKLVKSADCVIESFSLGVMGKLGLGYADLAEINPQLTMTSVTPYGQAGPYAHYKASDITLMGMGGLSYITGYPDGEPMRISFPQAELIAGAQAAAATVIALFNQAVTGEGQHIDVSIQASVTWTITNVVSLWELDRFNLRRRGSVLRGRPDGPAQQLLWRCKDGFVVFPIMGGGFFSADNFELVRWMDEEGMADEFIKNFDWENYDLATATPELHSRLEGYVKEFFLRHDKNELYKEGSKRDIKIYPLNTPQATASDPQLETREFWVQVEHPELEATLSYPGSFYKTTGPSFRVQRRPPLIGEHNQEIYAELGLVETEVSALKQANIV